MSTLLRSYSTYCHATEPGLWLQHESGRDFVAARYILALQAQSNYTLVIFENGSKHLMGISLSRVLSRLPSELFVRIHRGHALNRQYISSRSGLSVSLTDGSHWAISRRKNRKFLRDDDCL